MTTLKLGTRSPIFHRSGTPKFGFTATVKHRPIREMKIYERFVSLIELSGSVLLTIMGDRGLFLYGVQQRLNEIMFELFSRSV